MMKFRLYDYVLSGNCYKIRLAASLMGVAFEAKAVDFYPGFEHRSEAMLDLNPDGTLPVLQAGETVLSDTGTMLCWLAAESGDAERWNPAEHAEDIQQALDWAASLTQSVGLARLHSMLDWPVDGAARKAEGLKDLRALELQLCLRQLQGKTWLVGEGPSIADLACFPYVALSPDAGLEHDGFPALRNWLYAVKCLPGFITMPGIHVLHELR